ncbi:MAG: hypothetical protein FJY77_05985 [Candidatus Altiarchaeales archaeon]|nr:hypothetical protein [Candidatus Altiarchaeales archaeon]
MKERFMGKIAEAGRAMWEIKLFNLMLDTLICFLACELVITAFGLSQLYGVALAVVYLILAFLNEVLKSDTIKTMGEKHEKVDESLRTAYENRDGKNVIVERLLSDVSNAVDSMETSIFLDQRKLTSKMALSIILALMILFAIAIDIRGFGAELFKIDNIIRDVEFSLKERGVEYEKVLGGGDRWEASNLTTNAEKDKLGAEAGGERPGFHMGGTPGMGGGIGANVNEDIYGQASSAAIEGQEVDFNLRPDYGGEIEIKEDKTEEQQELEVTMPEDAESTETCDECAVGPGHEDLVKRYFEKILGEAR